MRSIKVVFKYNLPLVETTISNVLGYSFTEETLTITWKEDTGASFHTVIYPKDTIFSIKIIETNDSNPCKSK